MGCLINEKDACLFKHIASEVNRLSGTLAVLYLFDENKSEIDPVYNEVRAPQYTTPINGIEGDKIWISFPNPDKMQVSSEEGFQTEESTRVEIAKLDLEKLNLRNPRNGDVIYAWEKWWDVKTPHRAGLVGVSPMISVIALDLVRRTKDAPESVRLPRS